MANNFQFTANNSQFTGMQPAQSHVIMGPLSPHPPMSMQFRPGVPLPPPPPFIPPPVQFHRPQQYSQATPSLAPLPPPLQRPILGYGFPQGVPLQPPQFQPTFGSSIPPSYTPSSHVGEQQSNVGSTTQHQPISQSNNPNFSVGGQPWFPTGSQIMQPVMPPQQATGHGTGVQPWLSTENQNINSVIPLQHIQETNDGTQQSVPSQNQNKKPSQPEPVEKASSDWKEHTSRDGKKYFHNKKTGVSSWGKPLELMTPTERADATTDWREVTTPEGLKFFYNKVNKKSTWALPDEVKLAREQANLSLKEVTLAIKDINSHNLTAISVSAIQASIPDPSSLSLPVQQLVSTPILEISAISSEPAVISGFVFIQEEVANLEADTTGTHNLLEITTPRVASDTPMDITMARVATPTITSVDALTKEGELPSVEEGKESTGISDNGGTTSTLEGKKVEQGPLIYESKEEAKCAFKVLLESVNVGAGWNWDQAMRLIANDRRYAALKTLGERKQAFNEFVGQKKKQEAEEKRIRQKKAREGYKIMLEECKDLTSTTRWSKAVSMFENDERFQAIERAIDREDFFDDYIEEMKKMERAKVLEERKRFTTEYLEFLKSCNFINASSQWRKVQHRLENDERCSRLDKIERLEIFQEYVRDLEKEEEEQRKLRMEEQRKTERKNRDGFRKLMIEHVANGMINARTQWRDYCTKLKDAPAYMAVSANTSGFTPKDLFEDVTEDLEKQYVEDKERIEDAIKIEKISLSTSWTIEDFKAAVSKEIGSKPISDTNLMLVYDELLEKAKEREEKEAKKRKRLAEDVHDFLFISKEISVSSKWEDFKSLVEERFIGEESFFLEIFNKVIVELKGKEKEERKRKEEKARKERERKERKEKEKKEKEKEKEKERTNKDRESRKAKERRRREDTDSDASESHGLEENRRSRDRNRKHRKRHMDSVDNISLDADEKNDHSMSRRLSVDSKKSKQMDKPSLTSESQKKRRKRDNWGSSSRKNDNEEHDDGEFGEDGEIR